MKKLINLDGALQVVSQGRPEPPLLPHLAPAGTQWRAGMWGVTVHPSFDFETRSAAGFKISDVGKVTGVGTKSGLSAVGAPVYAEHPSTRVLSLAYNMKDGRGPQLWLPGTPYPKALLDYVANGGTIEAHNSSFEYLIWNLVCVKQYGWPPIHLGQLRCSMAKARSHSLPAALGNLAQVLQTSEKDKRGKQLLQKLSRPHSVTKNRNTVWHEYDTAPEEHQELWAYNLQDTVAEDDAGGLIPDLTPHELDVWLLDQKINMRGVYVDVQTLDAAIAMLAECERPYNARLAELTDGRVCRASEVAKIVEWAGAQGLPLESLDEKALDAAIKQLGDGSLPHVLEVLEIRRTLGSANVKKLHSIKLQVSSDGRLRDQYKYCGADRTGRWAAGGVQLQNITSASPPTSQCDDPQCAKYFGKPAASDAKCPHCGSWLFHDISDWPPEAVDQLCGDIRSLTFAAFLAIWPEPVKALCGILRGLFCAPPGKKLVCCDFSSIEAVVLACLARCQWRVDVFNTHGKIYEMSAADITGRDYQFYLDYKAENGHDHVDRKKIGKVAELASGYAGWVGAWRAFGAEEDDATIKERILAWRAASPEIVRFWGDEYEWCGPGKWDYRYNPHGLEGSAISSVSQPGVWHAHNDISFVTAGNTLYCRLPSGRFLHYHRPEVVPVQDRLNRGERRQLTFEGWNSNPQKGPLGWHRWDTYGGKLTENIVQATSRDLQANAMLRVAAAGHDIVMHTHDEITVEVPDDDSVTVEDIVNLMIVRPEWASWWPIRADGWEGKRYRK